MKPIKAITLSLGELDKVAISRYQFGLIVDKIYRKKTYKGEYVNLQKEFADKTNLNYYLNKLLDEGVLSPLGNLTGIYTLLGRTDNAPEDIACTIDPFCYMSHLSAMSYHGLTDRIPNKLFISTPPSGEWQSYAKMKMKKDLGENLTRYDENDMPKLVRTKMQKINKIEIHSFNSKHLGAYKSVNGRALRVSTMGRTFLEMLKNPEFCGGINHVLEVFEESGEKYLRLITDDIDRNGTPIDKVRAGYILNERLEINNNEVIESWCKFAQRGGSRKLDPKSEYISEWSDKWKISINIFQKGKFNE